MARFHESKGRIDTKKYQIFDVINTHKQALGYQNLFYLKKAQRIKPTLYDGSVISSQHVVIPVIDDEETLILEEVSRSKILEKQKDPISKEKKINTALINYVELNRLSEDFGKRFVPQQELSVEQAFWIQTSHPNTNQFATSPVKIKAHRELPKVSLINTSLKKLKYHLDKFDTVVKKHITPDAIIEGEWSFEHTKKCSVDKKLFEIEKKELKLKNERLLEHIICQDVVNIVMHADVKSDNVLHVQNTFLDDNIAFDVMKMENDHLMELLVIQDLVHTVVNSLATINDYKSMEKSYIKEYERNLKLAAELSQMNEFSKTCSGLKQRCISLELKLQHNKESFEIDKPFENQDAPEFHEFFIINELKALLQAKDTTISNLKKRIQEFKGKSVAGYRKSVNKPKVIALIVYKLDLEPLSLKLKNNREAHIDYIRITKENTDTLRDIVEQARTSNPLDNALAYAYNTSGPASHRKEKCTLQCALSSKEEKSTWLRAVLSTNSISSPARSVNKWINVIWSMTSKQLSLGFGLHQLTHGYISSRLMQNPVSPTPYVPTSKKDYEILFQPLFDEYFNPLPHVVSPDLVVVVAPRVVDPAGSPSSTTIDQDVPSANPSFEEATLQGVIPLNLHHLNQSFDTLTKLTKNHPLENFIGDHSRPVSTRSQLQEHVIWCYFDANDNLIPFGGKRSG
ncbi:hypothetical protein Tco_0864160 [Tanacetum coccineum]